jgi:lysophospholipase L1-like esterase
MRLRAVLAVVAFGAVLAGCSASPGDEGDGVPGDGPVVAFYGDSYTLGTGATDPAKRWSTVICDRRGWVEVNPSVNGLGFVNNRTSGVDLPGLVIDADPDIVFVTMGLNDNFSYGRVGEGIRDQIDADFERLTTALPDARFIVVEPFWYTDERPDSVEVIIDWVHEAADRIGADWVPDASHWIEGHPEWMAADGLHPNDSGYAEMTRRMESALAALGL